MLEGYPGLYHKGGGIHCTTDGVPISTTKLQPTLRTGLKAGLTRFVSKMTWSNEEQIFTRMTGGYILYWVNLESGS